MTENEAFQSPAPFVYRPLDPAKREIRLFHLSPTENSSDILTGTIVHVSLDDRFECDDETCYITISYVWGNSELCKTILVDGRTLAVTANAERALHTVRLTSDIHRIWIDSVCIDQTNLEERAQQVMLMGSIYENTCINSVLLIEDDEPMLERAIANIEAIHEEIRAEVSDLEPCDGSISSNRLPGFRSVVLNKADFGGYWTLSQIPLKTELDVEALEKFFSNPWFYRVWVVQEAVVACYNQCFIGRHEVNLRIVMRVAVWLYHKINFVPEGLIIHKGRRNAMNLWYLEEVFDPIKNPHSIELETLMDYTFHRETSDLRDKLYGLFGVTKYSRKGNKIPDLIRPDYTKSVDRVARDATRFLIREKKNLQVFCYIDHGTDAGPLPEICSWSRPFIRREKGYTATFPWSYKGIIPSFNTLSEDASRACTENPDLLHLTGIQIGLITEVSPVIPNKKGDWAVYLDTILTELGGWISTQDDQMLSNQFRRRLARTLVASVSLDECIATDQKIDAFDGILNLVLDECGRKSPTRSTVNSPNEGSLVYELSRLMYTYAENRTLFFMEDGKLGLGPGKLREGDAVVALQGSKWPAILRRIEEANVWQLLGLVYVDGIMNGEAADEYEKVMKSPTTFVVR